ncbi:MAG: hypothetical protein D4R67_11725 [Bacteroidetes bacterium]|nr:MAG: hypothetical protein D4R67_11725 [Bacteroidota bacterium]
MKKSLILFCAIAFLIMPGCKKEKADNTDQYKAMVNQIFDLAMCWQFTPNPVKGSAPINESIDQIVEDGCGGYVHTTGSVTGAVYWDDETGQVTKATAWPQYHISYVNYGSCGNCPINGDPYLTITGYFHFGPGPVCLLQNDSYLRIGGGFKDCNNSWSFNLYIALNPNGTIQYVSGWINDDIVYWEP